LAEAVEALRCRGLSQHLARKHAMACGPPTVREVLRCHQDLHDAGKLKDPVASLIGMLKNPAGWNFERTPDGWRAPPPVSGQASAPSDELIRRQHERRARMEQEAASGRPLSERLHEKGGTRGQP
jgi:hypothetical protein